MKVGQLIGQSSGFVSANIHSPISGVVTAIDSLPDGSGIRKPAIVITREGDEWLETIDRSNTLIQSCSLSAQEIIDKIAAAGIVSWVGLLVPHLIRLAFHRDFTSGFLLNLFGGAAFLLICDTMARCLFPIEIPISIITSLLGAPFLFWMMCRRREGL